jgi:hypothetical protein
MTPRATLLRQEVRSVAAKIWRQTRPLTINLASLLKQAKPGQGHDLIPPLGTAMGAVAFGLWRQSFAAALFAGIGLFFLAGIYETIERILVAIRRSDSERQFGDADDARTDRQPAPENSEALNEAIGSLKPWLANDLSLTEENAKEYCAVLLDAVAARARPVIQQSRVEA